MFKIGKRVWVAWRKGRFEPYECIDGTISYIEERQIVVKIRQKGLRTVVKEDFEEYVKVEFPFGEEFVEPESIHSTQNACQKYINFVSYDHLL